MNFKNRLVNIKKSLVTDKIYFMEKDYLTTVGRFRFIALHSE